MREHPLFHPRQEHRVELQAFGCVQSHQRDQAALVGRHIIRLGDQRHPLQEVGQGAVGVVVHELPGHRGELAEVLQAGFVLWVRGRLQFGHQAGLLEHRLHHVLDIRPRIEQHAQLVEQAQEATDAQFRTRADPGLLHSAQRILERDPIAVGEGVHLFHGAIPQPPFGHVENALQGQVVLAVVHDPQVGQGVPDLLTLVEPDVAHDLVPQAGA